MNRTHQTVESQAHLLVDLLLEARFSVGSKLEISPGSGIDSGKMVTVVSISAIKMKQTGGGLIPDLPGFYKPVDWDNEVPIRFEDGRLGVMFKNRLNPVTNESANLRAKILRRLDNLRRHHSAHYAQLAVAPFSTPPNYAMDDPNSEWWSSQEAQDFYDSLNERTLDS